MPACSHSAGSCMRPVQKLFCASILGMFCGDFIRNTKSKQLGAYMTGAFYQLRGFLQTGHKTCFIIR